MFAMVGSTRVVLSGEISTRSSASLIIEKAIRSLIELAGLEDSDLQTISSTWLLGSNLEYANVDIDENVN